MKIVHFWDMAGVSCVLAKWQRKNGDDSCVVTKTKVHDPFKFIEYYGEYGVNSNHDAMLYGKALLLARNADIVHIHGIPEAVIRFRMLGKKTILHCHGTELVTKRMRIISAGADRIVVSTRNLLDYCPDATFIPNPVDTEHFAPIVKGTGWVTFINRHLNMMTMKKVAERAGIADMVIHNRELMPISFKNMPEFLGGFEGYVDVKYDMNYGHLVQVYSKSALEALACGLKVLRWDGEIATGLPDENKPENVISQLGKLYSEVLK